MLERWPKTLPPQNALQESIHERHWKTRRLIVAALEDGYADRHKSAARRLSACCNGARIYIKPQTNQVRPWVSRCGHRLCPFCAHARSNRAARQIHTAMLGMRRPRMAVLTVKSDDRSLGEQLRSLRRSFAKLRRYKLWRKAVTGGIYTVEVTRNPQTEKWHPHLHVVYDGEYIAQKALRFAWHKATGTAEIVWIAAVRDKQTAAGELAKYVGKPQQVSDWPNAAIREYATAASRQRLLHTFGNLHGRTVEDSDRVEQPDDEAYHVRLSRVVHLAELGLETPATLALAIAKRWPMFHDYILHHFPQLQPPVSKARTFATMCRSIRNRDPAPRAPPHATEPIASLELRLLSLLRRFRFEDDAGDYDEAEQIREHQEWLSGQAAGRTGRGSPSTRMPPDPGGSRVPTTRT